MSEYRVEMYLVETRVESDGSGSAREVLEYLNGDHFLYEDERTARNAARNAAAILGTDAWHDPKEDT